MRIPQRRFENGHFTPLEYDLGDTESDDPTEGWDEYLERSGWWQAGHLPEHEYQDSAAMSCYIWRREEPGPDHGWFFIDVLFHDTAIVQIFCPTVIDFLMLLRDWIRPLINMTDRDLLTNAAIKATEVLFDETSGLACAVRYADKERRERLAFQRLVDSRKTKEGAA